MEKQLYKSRSDKFIGGVCAGIAQYFDIDPTIIRLATVLLAVATSGIVVLIYILLCFLIPYEPINEYTYNMNSNYNKKNNTYNASYEDEYTSIKKEQKKAKQYKLGIFLIIIGIFLLLDQILPSYYSQFMLPVALLVFGLILILSTSKDSSNKKEDVGEKSSYDDINNNETQDIHKEEEKEEPSFTEDKGEFNVSDLGENKDE